MKTLTSSNKIPATKIDVKNTNGTGSKSGVLDGKILSQVSADSLPKVDTACVPTVNAEPTTFTPKLDEQPNKIDDSDEDSGLYISLTGANHGPDQSSSPTPVSGQTSGQPVLSEAMKKNLADIKKTLQPLMSSASLVENVGHKPKKDWRIGRFAIHKMSTNYKAVLTGLNEYTKLLGEKNKPVHEKLIVELLNIETNATRYIKQHENTSSKKAAVEAMETLKQQVSQEILLVKNAHDLKLEERYQTWEAILPGARYRMLSSVARYNDVNLKGKPIDAGSGAVNKVKELTYEVDHKDVKFIFKPEHQKIEDEEIRKLQQAQGIDPDQPRLGVRNVAMAFVNEALGLKNLVPSRFALHDETIGLLMDKAPGRTAAFIKEIDLVAGKFQNCIDRKALPYNPLVMQEIKIRLDSIKSDFSLAWKNDKVKFEEATEGQQLDPNNWTSLAPAMVYTDLLQSETTGVGPRHANIQRELSNLEWLDGLCGQTDRHAANYLVAETGNNSFAVTGIDNDHSFGSKINALPPVVSYKNLQYPGNKEVVGKMDIPITGLPKLIDKQLAIKLRELDFDRHLKPTLDNLRLTPEEVSATKNRFKQLQIHADDLAAKGRVVGDWATHRIEGQSVHEYLVNPNEDFHTSYYYRDAYRPTGK